MPVTGSNGSISVARSHGSTACPSTSCLRSLAGRCFVYAFEVNTKLNVPTGIDNAKSVIAHMARRVATAATAIRTRSTSL